MNHLLRLSLWIEQKCSHPASALWATLLLLLWAAGGFALGWNDGWIAVGTFLISVPPYMLMFFLMVAEARAHQESKQREAIAEQRDRALHAKIDSLILAIDKADNRLVGIERREEVERIG